MTMRCRADSADISVLREASEASNETARDGATPSPRSIYDWEKDAFGCFEYWREWKGLQLFRSRIIAALKARAGR